MNHQVVLALLGNPRFLFSPFLTDPSKSKSVISPQVVDGAEEVGFHSNGFGFGASEVRLKREKGSTQVDSLEFFLFFLLIFIFFHFERLGTVSIISGDFWGTELHLELRLFLSFSAAGSRHNHRSFPWGLDRHFARFCELCRPRGMGATGRYEACGMLDFDCMAG